MSQQMMFEDTVNVTGSVALVDGPSLSNSRVGEINHFGRQAVHASRLAALDKEWENLTKDTCGRLSETLSASAALGSSLENKLRARMDLNGSPEYALTWKQRPMPSGPPICALRASRRRISDKDSTGWPTPVSRDHFPAHSPEYIAEKKAEGHGMSNLNDTAQMVGWPSPKAKDGREWSPNAPETSASGHGLGAIAQTLAGWVSPTAQDSSRGSLPPRPQDTGIPLSQQVTIAGWARPASRDHKDTPGMATTGVNPDGSVRNRMDQLPRQATLVGWNTPRATDGSNGGPNQAGGALPADARKAGWPTPLANKLSPQTREDFTPNLSAVALTAASGTPPSGIPASTESSGVFLLNPYFSAWLMSFPKEWTDAGQRAASRYARKSRAKAKSSKESPYSKDTAMPLSPSSPPSSSNHTSK